jgi:hypothetical protein
VATGLPYLFLNLINDVPAIARTVYQFKGVVEDNRAGWDAANYRYTVPVSGIYLIYVKVQLDPGNKYANPCIQTAPTPGGTYTDRVQAEVVANVSYNGNKLTAILRLAAGSGLRVIETQGAGWTSDKAPGANYLQLTLLSQ